MIGSYRSDELPRGHRLRSIRALLRRDCQLTEIELAPLCDDDVTGMMAALLGAVPQPTLAAAVARRADGLPFAVQELTFALRDSGHLAFSQGTVTLAGTGPAPVPSGIREAVLLRAARLTDEERALVDAAAVAGTEFDIDLVVAASGVAAWPDGFTGSGLLTDRGDGRSAFRHQLTRDAAYADIPWSRRRRLHRALASTVAADRGAPALIAGHLLAARDFGRPGALWWRRPSSISRFTPTGMPRVHCVQHSITGLPATKTKPVSSPSTGWPGARRCARSTPMR